MSLHSTSFVNKEDIKNIVEVSFFVDFPINFSLVEMLLLVSYKNLSLKQIRTRVCKRCVLFDIF